MFNYNPDEKLCSALRGRISDTKAYRGTQRATWYYCGKCPKTCFILECFFAVI